MSTSTVRSALVGAGIALASVTPTAVADGLRTRTVKLVELCVPMAPEDVDNRTSVSMRLQSILPDDHGCEVVIRVNNGMGPKDILSPTVPFGEGAYINVYGPTGAREERAIIGTCTPDWLIVDTRGSAATQGECPNRPLYAGTSGQGADR